MIQFTLLDEKNKFTYAIIATRSNYRGMDKMESKRRTRKEINMLFNRMWFGSVRNTKDTPKDLSQFFYKRR